MPTKRQVKDHCAERLDGDSVYVDAIWARTLRSLFVDVIEQHVDRHQVQMLRQVEREDRRDHASIAGLHGGGDD